MIPRRVVASSSVTDSAHLLDVAALRGVEREAHEVEERALRAPARGAVLSVFMEAALGRDLAEAERLAYPRVASATGELTSFATSP